MQFDQWKGREFIALLGCAQRSHGRSGLTQQPHGQ